MNFLTEDSKLEIMPNKITISNIVPNIIKNILSCSCLSENRSKRLIMKTIIIIKTIKIHTTNVLILDTDFRDRPTGTVLVDGMVFKKEWHRHI